MSINGSSGSCHPRRDAELIPICNRLLTDLHVVRKMKKHIVLTLSADLAYHKLVAVDRRLRESDVLSTVQPGGESIMMFTVNSSQSV